MEAPLCFILQDAETARKELVDYSTLCLKFFRVFDQAGRTLRIPLLEVNIENGYTK